MKITTKEVQKTARILDAIVKEYKEKTPEKKRDWKTYEQRLAERIRTAMKELEPLIGEAISSLKTVKVEKRGRKPKLGLKQKTVLLLLKHLFGKSNREMSAMLVVFCLLSDIDVSYKTIERLYSDEEVALVLQNMHALLLKKKGVERASCSGDGTGYSLTIKKHYATVAQKLKDKAKKTTTKKSSKKGAKTFIYSFTLMDLDTRMYIGYGTSFKSEKEAFLKAVEMAESAGVDSLRLDRYYSGQAYVELMEEKFGEVTLYLIPKKNATVKGPWEWKRLLHRFVNDTQAYLGEYFRRNQSESGISEDKRRFGWKIAQRREDRIDTATFCTVLWHNIFWLG
jgi:transposase